jgi:hypothetical protein
VGLEGIRGHEQVEAPGTARRDPPAAPLAVAAQRVRRRPLGAATPVTCVEEVEVRVHDMAREVLDVRRVALLTTAAARAALGAGAAEPGALADGRAGRGAVGDAVEEGEVMGDIALDAPRRELDDAEAVIAGEEAQNVGCRRNIHRGGSGCAVLGGRLITAEGVSGNPRAKSKWHT